MKVKVEKTDVKLGIKARQIITSEQAPVEFLQILDKYGWAKEIQDGEELISPVDKWQPKSYPATSIVYNKNCQYQARVDTSDTWVRREWELITGAEEYMSGEIYEMDNRVINHGSIFKAIVENTSDSWVTEEWEIILQGA